MFGVEWMDALTIGVPGLMIGSFLNVRLTARLS